MPAGLGRLTEREQRRRRGGATIEKALKGGGGQEEGRSLGPPATTLRQSIAFACVYLMTESFSCPPAQDDDLFDCSSVSHGRKRTPPLPPLSADRAVEAGCAPCNSRWLRRARARYRSRPRARRRHARRQPPPPPSVRHRRRRARFCVSIERAFRP